MAKNIDLVRKLVSQYISQLKNCGISVERAILYGSFAKGYATEFSDIDFAVISKNFSGERFNDRRKIIPLRRSIDERLEPMPFLPEDFHEGNPLAAEIMAHGIEIEVP